MKKPRFSSILLAAFVLAATAVSAQTPKPKKAESAAPADVLVEKSADMAELESIPASKVDTTKTLSLIAFGSCNDLTKPPFMFDAIAANNPDIWVWLGDIVYANTTDPKKLAATYKQLKTSTEYKKLTAKTPVIGIYDDHDYGANDAGKGLPNKKHSKKILLDFLGAPKSAPVRSREGAYQSYTFGKGAQRVKFIVLDTRYFRDTLLKDETGKSRYHPNMDGDMLGEAQWKWLENELRTSTANLNILCSSIQVISNEHPHEKWGNFPNCRKRLLNLIVQTKPKNLLIISGDRHMAEISKMDLQGLPYPLFDFTSSGLTHIRSGTSEANKFRVGPMLVEKNFGLLKVRWEGERPVVTMQIRSTGNKLLHELPVKY